MSCYYKVTKNPKTGQFEKAFWMDVVRFYYVAFPDGSMYHEQYCDGRAPTPAKDRVKRMTSPPLRITSRSGRIETSLLVARSEKLLSTCAHRPDIPVQYSYQYKRVYDHCNLVCRLLLEKKTTEQTVERVS